MYSLHLYDRINPASPTTDSAFRGALTPHARDWRRSIRAIGGFWQGDFTIIGGREGTMGRTQMINLYNTSMGKRIVENSGGITTWEGEIVELVLTLDGVQYRRTFVPNQWHNKVAVKYPAALTSFSEDTSSSDIYGESCYIDTVGSAYGSTAAEARRDRLLAENAWPRSRAVGGLGNTDAAQGNTLAVSVAGYVFSMNRRYQTTDIAAGNLSANLSTLIGNSEFVTAGRITSNTLSVPVQAAGIYPRLWDAIEELIEMGDASGNRYVGGAWAGRAFHYTAAETTVTHRYASGKLYTKAGTLVLPSQIRPDIIVDIANSPTEIPSMSGSDIDSYSYIEEVEFIAPDKFRLIPREGMAMEVSYA